jgi:hypothetical protein
MTNEGVAEIFALARAALAGGQAASSRLSRSV